MTGFFLRHEKRFIQAIRILLGLVFLWSSIDKIIHPGDFARSIANYKLLPEILVNLFAVVLPWVEAACGLLLLSGQWIRSASFLVSLMLAVFIVAVSAAMFRGLDINCGCFDSNAGRKVGFKLLAEDMLMLIMAVFIMLKAKDESGWRAFL